MSNAIVSSAFRRQFPHFLEGQIEDLVVDQAYLFKYVPQPGLRTEIHTDAGCLAFTFALNSKDEYEGGGTWVEGLVPADTDDSAGVADDGASPPSQVIEMDVGQCKVRPGGIRHCGNPLTRGTRYIIGGFCMSKKRVETVRQLLDNKKCQDETDSDTPATQETTKKALECAIALNPEFDGAYPNLANIYEEEGDTTKAKQVLTQCLEVANPKCTTASYYLGTMMYREGHYEKAREYMRTCLEVDATDGDAMGTLSQIYFHLREHEQEHELYQRILLTPGVSARILSNAYCNLGTMQDDVDTEMEFYQKALELEPGNLSARQSLGSAYASKGDWDNAIDCYRRVVDSMTAAAAGAAFTLPTRVGMSSSSTSPKSDEEALRLLYRAATKKLRSDDGSSSSSADQSRDVVMARLGQLMGQANLDRLLAMKR